MLAKSHTSPSPRDPSEPSPYDSVSLPSWIDPALLAQELKLLLNHFLPLGLQPPKPQRKPQQELVWHRGLCPREPAQPLGYSSPMAPPSLKRK